MEVDPPLAAGRWMEELELPPLPMLTFAASLLTRVGLLYDLWRWSSFSYSHSWRLEAHVRKDDWPTFAREREGLCEGHVFLLHEVCDDAGSASGYTRIAVDEHTTFRYALLDELDGSREMPDQTTLRGIRHVDDFVLEVLGEEGPNARGYLEDVRDSCLVQSLHV